MHSLKINIPIMLPKAHTACSQTFWWGDCNNSKNNGTAPVKNENFI